MKRKTYTETLEELKKEIRISSFDTIYTSFLVFGAGILITLFLFLDYNTLPKFSLAVIIFLSFCFLVSLILQVLSLFFGINLKKISIVFLCLSAFALVLFIIAFIQMKEFFFVLFLLVVYLIFTAIFVGLLKYFNKFE